MPAKFVLAAPSNVPAKFDLAEEVGVPLAPTRGPGRCALSRPSTPTYCQNSMPEGMNFDKTEEVGVEPT